MSRKRVNAHRAIHITDRRWLLWRGILYEAVGPIEDALEESDVTAKASIDAQGSRVDPGKKIPVIKPAYGDQTPVLPVFANDSEITVSIGMELDLDNLIDVGAADGPRQGRSRGKRKPRPAAVVVDTILLGGLGEIKPGEEVPLFYKTQDGRLHLTDVEGLIEKGLVKPVEGSR